MRKMNFVKGFVLGGALLLPVILTAQDVPQDRGEVRGDRRQVRKDRKAAVKAPVGDKAPERQAAREDRKTTRSDRRETRQDRKEETPKQ
jgi:hypothetical protein